jgi:hypothetical protein
VKAIDFTKYFEGGLTQGPTSLNLLITHTKFGPNPWAM